MARKPGVYSNSAFTFAVKLAEASRVYRLRELLCHNQLQDLFGSLIWELPHKNIFVT